MKTRKILYSKLLKKAITPSDILAFNFKNKAKLTPFQIEQIRNILSLEKNVKLEKISDLLRLKIDKNNEYSIKKIALNVEIVSAPVCNLDNIVDANLTILNLVLQKTPIAEINNLFKTKYYIHYIGDLCFATKKKIIVFENKVSLGVRNPLEKIKYVTK